MFKPDFAPENQVLEAIYRIQLLHLPFCAVHIAFSKLSADNKTEENRHKISALFHPLLTDAQARLFILSNNDLLVLTSTLDLDKIENVLFQVKKLFETDPLFTSSQALSFQQIFFLDKDKDDLERFLSAHDQNVPAQKALLHNMQTLSIDSLEKLTALLQLQEKSSFINRQSVLDLKNNTEIFQEFYTAMTDLQKKLIPDVDLTTHKSLFFTLTETLDKRMLVFLSSIQLSKFPQAISINLNLDSIFTDEFDNLARNLSCPLIIEFQIADIFHRLPLFQKACEKLQSLHIQTLLDGVGINEFESLNLLPFQTNYLKLFWSPKWLEEDRLERVKKFVLQNENLQVVLARCSCEEALTAGKKMNIHLFQGFFVDSMQASATKKSCVFGQECSLQQCCARHLHLANSSRNQCVHLPHLDNFSPLRRK